MASVNDNVRDSGLDYADTNGTRIDLCSSDPGLTYANVTANTLANATVNTGATTNYTSGGRKVVVPAISSGTVTGTGTGTHWALTNGSSIVIASGALSSSIALTSGNNFSLDAIDIIFEDATDAVDYGIYTSNVLDTVGDGSRPCEAGVRYNTDGTIDKVVYNNSYTEVQNWCTPTSYADVQDHWVRFVRISGDSAGFTGTLNTWLKVSGTSSSNREIVYNVSAGAGILSGTYSVEIATDSGGSNIVAGPSNITLTANSEVS